LALLYGGGLRRLEVVNLDVEDVDVKVGEILVSGKGRRERRVPLPNGALAALHDWLRVRGDTAGPLILPLGPDGLADDGRRLSPSAICASLRRRSQRCGVKDFTVHDLRRTYISDLLEDGRELEVVARLVGHRNVNTTARYDRRGDARARRAAKARNVPYTPPGALRRS
jgi:integrase